QRLDDYGIHYIEGGWPGSNPKDEEFFVKAQNLNLKNTELVAFSSTKKIGINVENDVNINKLITAGVKTVTIFAKSWDFHVIEALNISCEENLKLIEDTIKYLKYNGMNVFFKYCYSFYPSSNKFINVDIVFNINSNLFCRAEGY